MKNWLVLFIVLSSFAAAYPEEARECFEASGEIKFHLYDPFYPGGVTRTVPLNGIFKVTHHNPLLLQGKKRVFLASTHIVLKGEDDLLGDVVVFENPDIPSD